MQKKFVVESQENIDLLFETKLKPYRQFVSRLGATQQKSGHWLMLIVKNH